MKHQSSSALPKPRDCIPRQLEKGPKNKAFIFPSSLLKSELDAEFAVSPVLPGAPEAQGQPSKICNVSQDPTLRARNASFKVTGFLVSCHCHGCQPLPLARRWVTQVWAIGLGKRTQNQKASRQEAPKRAPCRKSLSTGSPRDRDGIPLSLANSGRRVNISKVQ